MIVEIVPDKIEYAVEVYVRPVDLPLIAKGQKIRFLFDGFPAIVFSGMPQFSYGTFGGIVTAVESSVSPNGRFRVLVIEDPTDRPWPRQLKMGTGARGIALLVSALSGLEVAEYAPNLVKKTVVGSGHAEKTQIRAMVRILLPKADPKSEDAADALAIAVTHAHHRNARMPLVRS